MTKRDFFIKFKDCNNTARVVRKTKDLCKGSTFVWKYNNVQFEGCKNSIVFLCSHNLSKEFESEILSLISKMKLTGWSCQISDIRKANSKVALGAKFVVFCGLDFSETALDTAEFVKENGGKVIYYTDNLMHDETALMQSDIFLANRHDANKICLLGSNIAQTMALADGFLATTPTVLRSVKIFDKPAAIVPTFEAGAAAKQLSDFLAKFS